MIFYDIIWEFRQRMLLSVGRGEGRGGEQMWPGCGDTCGSGIPPRYRN